MTLIEQIKCDFRGCFKEVALHQNDGSMFICGYRLLPAPNRFRKMMTAPENHVTSWGEGLYDLAAVVSRQSAEYPWPDPVGFEFDLFDSYLAWRMSDLIPEYGVPPQLLKEPAS